MTATDAGVGSSSNTTRASGTEELEDAYTFEDLLRCIAKKHTDLKFKHAQLLASAPLTDATAVTLGLTKANHLLLVENGIAHTDFAKTQNGHLTMCDAEPSPRQPLTMEETIQGGNPSRETHLFDETQDPPASIIPQSQLTDLPKNLPGGDSMDWHEFDDHELRGPRSAMQAPSPTFNEPGATDPASTTCDKRENEDTEIPRHSNGEHNKQIQSVCLEDRDNQESGSFYEILDKQFSRLDYNREGIISAWNAYQCLRAIHMLNLGRGKPPPWRKVSSAFADYVAQTQSLSDTAPPKSVHHDENAIGIDHSQFLYLVSCSDNERARLSDVMVQVREALHLEESNQFVRLRTHGLMVKNRNGVSSNMIDSISGTVICLNAIVLGLSADVAKNSWVWDIVEFMFTIYFTGELVYKAIVNGPRWFFLGVDNKWNMFDFAVVTVALVDMTYTIYTWPNRMSEESEGEVGGMFPIMKMIRLGRLARLVRLLRLEILSELKSMIQGVVAGARVLFWAVCLLCVIIYFLAVLLRKTIGDTRYAYATTYAFEDVVTSMFTIFRCITAGCAAYDGTPLEIHLFRYFGSSFFVVYSVLILCITIGVFNLIMAIFIDNVMSASIHRKQRERGDNAEVMITKLKEMILTLAMEMPANELRHSQPLVLESIQVTREEFNAWLENKEFLELLNELDIGSANKSELFDTLDFDLSGELEASEVITGLMKLRGPSDKCDAVAMLLGLRYVTQKVEDLHRKIVLGEDVTGD
eukprot:TRINITY_DN49673_c0_g1_i1.p1 TRINITY_DN49673_c0_g1~~TRINITY_DN49673_c0_g1_i1.p1  ORF type:complete len:753 (+),score=100.28 TRINITY_DN49673_c0_g1_i1:53-2311(+)